MENKKYSTWLSSDLVDSILKNESDFEPNRNELRVIFSVSNLMREKNALYCTDFGVVFNEYYNSITINTNEFYRIFGLKKYNGRYSTADKKRLVNALNNLEQPKQFIIKKKNGEIDIFKDQLLKVTYTFNGDYLKKVKFEFSRIWYENINNNIPIPIDFNEEDFNRTKILFALLVLKQIKNTFKKIGNYQSGDFKNGIFMDTLSSKIKINKNYKPHRKLKEIKDTLVEAKNMGIIEDEFYFQDGKVFYKINTNYFDILSNNILNGFNE